MQTQFRVNNANAFKHLIKLTSSLSTERDINNLLKKILHGALSIVGADSGLIYLLDSSKKNLVVEVFEFSNPGTKHRDFDVVPLLREGNRNTIQAVVNCAFTGAAVNVNDVYQYSGYDYSDVYNFDISTGYRTRSVLNVPMVDHNGITVGVLQLINALGINANTKYTDFSENNLEVARSFASQAAIAIENAKLNSENEHLIRMLNHSNEELEQENRRLRQAIEGAHDFSNIIGDSESIRNTFKLMKKVMNSDATVLVTGETGTGKELVASAIHNNSQRRNRGFVAQNCSALPADLLESELFGYVKGAFSGAAADKSGLIKEADGGTLFLDEIGDMPLSLQAKILRVIQEKELRPLGATRPVIVNVRIIAATHKNLKQMVAEGTFREDLYYRLAVFPIQLASLKERADDLPTLVTYFIDNYCRKYAKNIKGVSPKVLDILIKYDYPGNIRELRNIIERAVLLADDESAYITPDLLPEEVFERGESIQSDHEKLYFKRNQSGGLKSLVGQFEAELIEQKLQQFNWNQSRTARELDVGRRTLIDKINRYGLRA